MTGNRNTGLDIVRALAVMTVVMWHGENVLGDVLGWGTPVWTRSFGPVSVELFYGLSGYLIGRILLNLIDAPTPSSWLRFMTRRWTRTLPLYFTVLAVVALLARPDAALLMKYATMTQNVFSAPTPSMLAWLMVPSWSLTVEEIFYLSFATTLLTAAAVFGRRAVWPTVLLFMTAPLIFRICTYGQDQVYLAAVGNLDGIAWGVALAQLQREGSDIFRFPYRCLAAGSVLIAFTWFPYDTGLLDPAVQWMPGSFTISSAGCCLVIVAAMTVHGYLGWFGAVVRAISVRSYSAYLVHIPVFTVVRAAVESGGLPVPAGIAVAVTSVIGLSYAAHRWIEVPGMRIGQRAKRPALLQGSVVA